MISYWGVDHAEEVEKALPGVTRFAGAAKQATGALRTGFKLGGVKGMGQANLKPAGAMARGGLRQVGAAAKTAGGTLRRTAVAAPGQVKTAGSNFAAAHPNATAIGAGAGIGAAGAGAISAPFLAYNHSKAGQKQQFQKSFWGVEHGEVSKLDKNSDRYKALVWNKDVVGGTAPAKRNRQISRRAQLKGQGAGLAAGAAAGGAVAAGVGATRFGRAGARLAGKGARMTGAKQGVQAWRPGIGTGLSTLGGASAGQLVGDYKGRMKAMKHPDWKKRTD